MNNAEKPQMNEATYQGLQIWYALGREDRIKNAAIVIAVGLGVPKNIEYERLAWMFSEIGYPTAYTYYTGTWLDNRKKGKFLKQTKEGTSPDIDITTTIEFMIEKFGTEQVNLLGTCFGATPVLVAGAKNNAVKKILTVGGMIYTDNDMANEDYKKMDRNINTEGAETDYFLQLGREHKKQYGKESYNGFSFRKWKKIVMGKTSHNAYNYLDQLKHKQYLGIHALDDKLVSHKRTILFTNKLKRRAEATGTAEAWIINPADYGVQKIGHRGIEQIPELHQKIIQFYNPNETEETIQETLEEMVKKYPKIADFFKRKEHITKA